MALEDPRFRMAVASDSSIVDRERARPARTERGFVDNVIDEMRSDFNFVRVCEQRGRIDFDVDGATFATWHASKLCTGYSWDAVAAACLLGLEPPKTVLVLGLAGGTCTRQLRQLSPAVEITAVEIDGALVDLARKHMDLDAQRLDVHVGDAYAFLENTRQQWDVIVDDLFLTGPEDVVRSRVPEGEVLELLRSRLAPRGVLAANVITDEGHTHVASATRAAFTHAFAKTCGIVPPRGLNEVVVGSERLRQFAEVRALAARFPNEADRRWWRSLRTTSP